MILLLPKKTKWNHTDKVPVYNKTSKKYGLRLKLTKEEFVTKLKKFGDENCDNIHLIPIVNFNKNDYFVEIVWVVQIGKDIDIGIAFKRNDKYKAIMPSGIYLDINDQHKLLKYEHECKCLDSFKCIIDHLEIGRNTIVRTNQSVIRRQINEDLQLRDQIKETCRNLQQNLKKTEIFLQSVSSKQNELNQLQTQFNQQQNKILKLMPENQLQIYQNRIQENNSRLLSNINKLDGNQQ
eukprot:479318_1